MGFRKAKGRRLKKKKKRIIHVSILKAWNIGHVIFRGQKTRLVIKRSWRWGPPRTLSNREKKQVAQ